MINKTNALLFIGTLVASLLLGGFALHDRSQALAYGNHRRVLLDDAVLASMSLPTGAALLIYDSERGR
jgi:hypothetical protein